MLCMSVMVRYITVAVTVAVLNIFLIRHFILFLFDICFFLSSRLLTIFQFLMRSYRENCISYSSHFVGLVVVVFSSCPNSPSLFITSKCCVFFMTPPLKWCAFFSNLFISICIGEFSSSLCLISFSKMRQNSYLIFKLYMKLYNKGFNSGRNNHPHHKFYDNKFFLAFFHLKIFVKTLIWISSIVINILFYVAEAVYYCIFYL